MRTLRRFLKRLISWTRTENDEERLQAEIEEHLALQTADNIRAGLPPAEARRQAALKFGAVEATKESYRDQRGLPMIEALLRDLRHALRRLRMAPAFAITTILTLALGIGATTSIFTLAHAVLLKSLPVANPAELYRLGKEARCCFWSAYSQDKEIFSGLLRSVQVFSRQYQSLCATGGVRGERLSLWRSAGRRRRGCSELSGRICIRQLLRDVRHQRVRGTDAYGHR